MKAAVYVGDAASLAIEQLTPNPPGPRDVVVEIVTVARQPRRTHVDLFLRNRHRHGQHVLGIQSRVDTQQPRHAFDHQTGARKHHQGDEASVWSHDRTFPCRMSERDGVLALLELLHVDVRNFLDRVEVRKRSVRLSTVSLGFGKSIWASIWMLGSQWCRCNRFHQLRFSIGAMRWCSTPMGSF